MQIRSPIRARERFANQGNGRLEAGAPLRLLLLALVLAVIPACNRNSGAEAVDSDANGYVCLKCGAKLYTSRTDFIGPKCPKCQTDSLMPVVGYYCEKDKHLTLRPQRGDTKPIVCEICQMPLVNAMRMPKESELKAWGAVKP